MPVERLSPKLSMSSRMNRKKQQFRELTPDRRPQDPHGRRHRTAVRDGRTQRGLSRQQPQAITVTDAQARWAVYVPLRVNGKIVVPDQLAH
jgi:hypothetical protein